jgi:hypothetical protein
MFVCTPGEKTKMTYRLGFKDQTQSSKERSLPSHKGEPSCFVTIYSCELEAAVWVCAPSPIKHFTKTPGRMQHNRGLVEGARIR